MCGGSWQSGVLEAVRVKGAGGVRGASVGLSLVGRSPAARRRAGEVESNPALTSIQGFENVQSISGYLYVRACFLGAAFLEWAEWEWFRVCAELASVPEDAARRVDRACGGS